MRACGHALLRALSVGVGMCDRARCHFVNVNVQASFRVL